MRKIATADLEQVVQERGGGRSVVVLVPGLGANESLWAPLIERYLSQWRVDVILVNGVSVGVPVNDLRNDIRVLGREHAARLKELGYQRLLIIGHSLGFILASEIAAALRDGEVCLLGVNAALIDELMALDDPRHVFRDLRSVLYSAWLTGLIVIPLPGWFKRFVAGSEWASRLLIGGLVGEEFLKHANWRFIVLDADSQPNVVPAIWSNRHYWKRFHSLLLGLRIPVTIVGGEVDPIANSSASKRLSDMIKGSRLTLVPRVGHCIPLEATGLLAVEVNKLLNALGIAQGV